MFLLKLKNLHIENWKTLQFTTLPSAKPYWAGWSCTAARLVACTPGLLRVHWPAWAAWLRPVACGQRPEAWARRAWPVAWQQGAGRQAEPRSVEAARRARTRGQDAGSRSLVASSVVGLLRARRPRRMRTASAPGPLGGSGWRLASINPLP